MVKSQGKGQSVEVQVSEINILGESDPDTYPIQPKKHSFEFLRENAHLRTRNKYVEKSSHEASILFHLLFIVILIKMVSITHTPIITASDHRRSWRNV